MRPAISREGSINSEGNQVGEGSTQSGEPRWTCNSGVNAVFHDRGCKTCDDWRKHYDDHSDSLEEAQETLYGSRDEALESKRAHLGWDRDEACLEIRELRRELQRVQSEIKAIQQGQKMFEDLRKQLQLRVVTKIRRTLDQLGDETEDARGASPRTSKPSSHRPQKRRRLTDLTHRYPRDTECRPTTSPQAADPIWVGSESDGDAVPVPTRAPIAR